MNRLPNNLSHQNLSDLVGGGSGGGGGGGGGRSSFTSESLLSMSLYTPQQPPLFVLGITKKTTQSDFIYDEVYQDISFADNVTIAINPYSLYSHPTTTKTTTTATIPPTTLTIDDFPIELQRMISTLERQEILQSLELTCLQANTKRWHLISECSKIAYHYRSLFWWSILSQTFTLSYQQWYEKLVNNIGEFSAKSIYYVMILPFYCFLMFSLVVVGCAGLIVDICVGRVWLRGLSCIHHQFYDFMMLYPEYSTSLVDECIKEDLEKIAMNMERMYGNQLEIIVSTERHRLHPSSSWKISSSCCQQQKEEEGLDASDHQSRNQLNSLTRPIDLPSIAGSSSQPHSQHRYYDDYDFNLKKKLGLYYEERFLLYFYPVQSSSRMIHSSAKDTVYFNSTNLNQV